MTPTLTYTQAELLDESIRRFGPDIRDMAFVCPRCGDIASVREFQRLGVGYKAGTECIGRSLGALLGPRTITEGGVRRGLAPRGCDCLASAPLDAPCIVITKGVQVRMFDLAPALIALRATA